MNASASGVSLPKKLGIRPGAIVLLVDAPAEFESTLGALPDGAVLRRDAARVGPVDDLVVWFVRTRAALADGIAPVSARAGKGGLWIAWPKKASGVTTDVAESVVRMVGLAAGFVDYKVCAIDAVWSGLKFARR